MDAIRSLLMYNNPLKSVDKPCLFESIVPGMDCRKIKITMDISVISSESNSTFLKWTFLGRSSSVSVVCSC